MLFITSTSSFKVVAAGSMRNLTPGNGAACTDADRAISLTASCSGARAFAHNADMHVSGSG